MWLYGQENGQWCRISNTYFQARVLGKVNDGRLLDILSKVFEDHLLMELPL